MPFYLFKQRAICLNKDGRPISPVISPVECWPETKRRIRLEYGRRNCKILWHTAHKTHGRLEFTVFCWVRSGVPFNPKGV